MPACAAERSTSFARAPGAPAVTRAQTSVEGGGGAGAFGSHIGVPVDQDDALPELPQLLAAPHPPEPPVSPGFDSMLVQELTAARTTGARTTGQERMAPGASNPCAGA